jgi:hypothetical protein
MSPQPALAAHAFDCGLASAQRAVNVTGQAGTARSDNDSNWHEFSLATSGRGNANSANTA